MNSGTEEVQDEGVDEGVNKSTSNIPPPPQSSSFPYTGIFSPGGFLATVSNVEEDLDGSFSCPAATVTINSTVSHTAHQESGQKSNLELSEQSEGEEEPGLGPGSERNPDFIPALPSSEHALFAIDLVLEKIMRSLETRELLTCRRVCHRWLSFANLQLQKSPSLKICFADNILSHTRTTEATFNTISLPNFQLDLLTDLVRPYSENCLSGFPCSKLDFYSETVNSDVACREFQNFLHVYGVHIRELSIECKPPQFEKSVMKLISKLILEQVPNLRCLSLYLTTVTGTNSKTDKAYDCQSSKLKQDNSNSSVNNKNASLKVLQMGRVPSSAILEMVLALAPNLDEMILDKYNYKYFTEPFSRIHLLKKLHFDPENSVAIDALEKIALANSLAVNNSGSELKLREIYIYNWRKFQKKEMSAELRNKCVFTINRFFESSWDTLKTIEWSGVSFLNGRVLWPKVMPNVRKVDLATSRQTETETETEIDETNNTANIFPPGFSLSRTFPKLHTVYLYDYDGGTKFAKFLNSLSYDKKAALTVKNVHLSNSVSERSSREVLNLVKELFPCANIHDGI